MKKKIVGIFVCMLLITTALPVVGIMIKNEQSIKSQSSPSVEIIKPKRSGIYFAGIPIMQMPRGGRPALVIGKISFQIKISPIEEINRVTWYVDNNPVETRYALPYNWSWGMISDYPFLHNVSVTVLDLAGKTDSDYVNVFKIL